MLFHLFNFLLPKSVYSITLNTYNPKVPSTTLLPVIYTVHISFPNLFITIVHSNESCRTKQIFTLSQNQLQFDYTVSSSISGLGCTSHMKNIVWKYWVVIVDVILSDFHGPVKFSECLILYIKSAVYIKCFVTFNRYMTRW